MIAGNAPIIVDKVSGEITETGTSYDVEYYIKEYRNRYNTKR